VCGCFSPLLKIKKDLFYFFLPGEKWLALLLLGRVTLVRLISRA
jgi:hypothetical protein